VLKNRHGVLSYKILTLQAACRLQGEGLNILAGGGRAALAAC
jgi:hypothetical protein